MLGLIGTRSIDTPIMGLKEILQRNRERIHSGQKAYALLQNIKDGQTDDEMIQAFETHKADLGYGLLLKRYTENVVDATEEQIEQAVLNSIPRVPPLFWTFRVMVACGFVMLLVFVVAVLSSSVRKCRQDWILKLSLYTMPLPWIACEAGWFVAEFGRQPWTIAEVLPTFLSASSLTEWDLIVSLSGFFLVYSVFLVIELFLMMRFVRQGPSSLHKHRYHFEVNERS